MAYLQVNHVSKIIKKVKVLDNVTLQMDRGKIYGLQGRNGSGKSMLLRAICGLIIPTSGEVIINGINLRESNSFPESCGILIDSPGFLSNYSLADNLRILAEIRGVIGEPEIEDALERVGLEENQNKKYRHCSLGMKQKLGIAAAIMEKPEMLLLDEPTNALDEKSVRRLWNIVKEERERGALVIISSHDAGGLESVADVVYHMEEGRIALESKKEEVDH